MPRSKGRIHLEDTTMMRWYPKQLYFFCGPPFKSTNPKTNLHTTNPNETTCVTCKTNYEKRNK